MLGPLETPGTLTLALAIVTSSEAPLLLLDAQFEIISERRYSSKGRIDFVIRLPGKATRASVDGVLNALSPDVRAT